MPDLDTGNHPQRAAAHAERQISKTYCAAQRIEEMRQILLKYCK